MHVDKGRLSLVGAQEVPGPLVIPDFVGSGLVYEVLAGERRIGVGALPDANVRRAFTNIDQKEAALGHNPTELESYEFVVRVPKSELAPERLASIEIHLHQVAVAQPLPEQPLKASLRDAVRTLASLSGVDIREQSPGSIELARILKIK